MLKSIVFGNLHLYFSINVAPPTQGIWRSNDYVNAIGLVDGY